MFILIGASPVTPISDVRNVNYTYSVLYLIVHRHRIHDEWITEVCLETFTAFEDNAHCYPEHRRLYHGLEVLFYLIKYIIVMNIWALDVH